MEYRGSIWFEECDWISIQNIILHFLYISNINLSIWSKDLGRWNGSMFGDEWVGGKSDEVAIICMVGLFSVPNSSSKISVISVSGKT